MRATLVIATAPLLCACTPSAPPAPPSTPVVTVSAPPSPVPSAVAPPAADESFRAEPPPLHDLPLFAPPAATRARLRNGIPVVVVQRPSAHCSIWIIADRHAADAGGERAEAITEMANGMILGTVTQSRRALADRYASLFAHEPEVDVYPDAVSLSFSAAEGKLDVAVALAADVALHPSFERASFERMLAFHVRAREANAPAPDAVASNVLRRVVFGKHPYATVSSVARLRAMTRADAQTLHAALFDASRLSIVVAGPDEPEATMSVLESAFGGVTARHVTRAAAWPVPAAPSGPRMILVDKPGASTASIAAGFIGPSASAADWSATNDAIWVVANPGFGRLERRLTEELHDVPAISEGALPMRRASFLTWRARSETGHVVEVLTEAGRILSEFAATGPTEAELRESRDGAASTFALSMETAPKTAQSYALAIMQGRSPEELASQPARSAALALDDLKEAAARYLAVDRMRVVVVGDAAALRAPLAGLGWGRVEVRDMDGAIVRDEERARAHH